MNELLAVLLRLIDVQLQVWIYQLDPGLEHRAYMLGYNDGLNAQLEYADEDDE